MSATELKYYVMITEGDGSECLVFAEQDLKQALHTRLCTCNSPWAKCDTDGVKLIVESLDDDDEWTHPYPGHERTAWSVEFEESTVQVVRLTFADDYDLMLAQNQRLRNAYNLAIQCLDFAQGKRMRGWDLQFVREQLSAAIAEPKGRE